MIAASKSVRFCAASLGGLGERDTARAWLEMQTAYDLARERAAGTPKVFRLDHVA